MANGTALAASGDGGDPWLAGTLNHAALWSVYTAFNVVGSAMCAVVIAAVARHKAAQTSADVLVPGAC